MNAFYVSESENLSKADLELLELLFRSEYENMVDYARFILYYKEWAEDAVQEAFAIGVKKMSDLYDSENQVGWLYRTLQNVVKNKNREFQRFSQLVEKVTASADDRDVGIEPSFEPQVLFHEGYKGLLKESDWNMLKDIYCNGYKYKELAEKYDKSISACKMQVLRAKNILEEKLRKNFDEML